MTISDRTKITSYKKRGRRSSSFALPTISASRPFWLMAALVVLAFLTGGSSRGDVASFIVLRPVACLIGALGLLSLRREQVLTYRWLFLFMLACLVLIGFELLPLSPALFAKLPGRGIVTTISQVGGLGETWRPMSLTPSATLDTLDSMVVPVAALILVVQLEDDDHKKLLALFLLVGLASALLAMAQISGDPKGPLYFYEAASGDGSAKGFFANKNHQAVFLASLIPMLAAFRDMTVRRIKDNRRQQVFGSVVLVSLLGFIPLLLVSNSRAGLVAGVLGLSASIWAFGRVKAKRIGALLLLTGGAILFGIALLSERALAWNRFVELDPIDDLRYKIIPLVREAIVSFLPFGAGGGGFANLYVLKEPDKLLSPVFMNQVHNDWLDIALSHGMLGVMLGLALTSAVARFIWLSLRQHVQQSRAEMGRAASIALLLLAMGSISDYPLRTSALQIEWVVLMVWLCRTNFVKTRSSREPRFAHPSFNVE